MIEGFDAHQEQLRAMQSTPDSAITDTAAEVEPFKRERSLSTTTTLVSVATTKAVTGCDYPCPCQCHIRSSYETPTWLKTAFGVLFASYTGSPVWGRQPCNYRPCMRSGASQTSYTWHFPTWMIAKAVALSFSRSSLTGLGGSWSLHIPKSLAGDNPVWRFLNYGTVPQLVDVMSSGVASPCDMNEDGKSLLHVSRYRHLIIWLPTDLTLSLSLRLSLKGRICVSILYARESTLLSKMAQACK